MTTRMVWVECLVLDGRVTFPVAAYSSDEKHVALSATGGFSTASVEIPLDPTPKQVRARIKEVLR